jgi:putative modified peptide
VDLTRIREHARALAERLTTDPAFRETVERDPAAALRAAGLPDDAHNEFLATARDEGILPSADVAGYALSGVSCGCQLSLQLASYFCCERSGAAYDPSRPVVPTRTISCS